MATIPEYKTPALLHTGKLSPKRFARRRAGIAGLLDRIADQLRQGGVSDVDFHSALDEMILALREKKQVLPPHQWTELSASCRQHSITDLLHQDPFTYRAFVKPRGYPGDAELLDYIYGAEELWPAPAASDLGRRIFDYTTRAPAPEGVRARRGFIADKIDRLAEERQRPQLLSLAAGHLREAILTSAVKRRRLGRYVALDADPESLGELSRCYGRFGVQTVQSSVRRCISGSIDLGKFDFIYSIGLFDYLGRATGRRLLGKMFDMLRPGGQLLVANFLPDVRDIGYMEVFMDWKLIYRTRYELLDLTVNIPQPQIKDICLFAEENQNIIFLQVTRG